MMAKPRPLKRVVIREELVALAGDLVSGVLLGQMMYWHERTRDTDKYILEETERMNAVHIDSRLLPTYGWIYKTASDILDETMLGCSERTINRSLDLLVQHGWIQRRNNPNYKWDRTYQYRVDLCLVQEALRLIGYQLQGYVFDDACKRQDDASSRATDAALPEITIETTKDIALKTHTAKEKDTRSSHATIQAVRSVTGKYPSKDVYDLIIRTVPIPDIDKMKRCFEAWRAKDFKPTNIAWLTDWYVNGIPQNGMQKPTAPTVPYQDPVSYRNPITGERVKL